MPNGNGIKFFSKDVDGEKKDIPLHCNRKVYFMEKGKTYRGCWKDGDIAGQEEVELKGDLSAATTEAFEHRGYYPSGKKLSTPLLCPTKLLQRLDSIKGMSGGGVLQVYAGEGTLGKEVYDDFNYTIMVDKDGEALNKGMNKLRKLMKVTAVKSDAHKFCQNNAKQLPSGIKVVDFDPYGGATKDIDALFGQYPVNHTTILNVTDGSFLHANVSGKEKGQKWLKENYGGTAHTKLDMVGVLDRYIERMGKKHKFHVDPLSVGLGRSQTIYAGYKLTPAAG
jgi:hypothetical protein